MDLLVTLLLAHLIADFPLQTNWVFQWKMKNWIGVAVHASIHVIVTLFLVQNVYIVWPAILLLGILHFLCDLGKVHLSGGRESLMFIVDQAIHIAVLVVIASQMPSIAVPLPNWFLYPAVIYALIPAGMVFLSVLNAEMNSKRFHAAGGWSSQHMLVSSRYIGIPLLAGIILVLFALMPLWL